MGTRGPQPGSGGRPKKPLAEKVLEGNPGKRPLETIPLPDAADLRGETMPPPREFLAARQKGGGATKAVEIYESTWRWLHERACDHLIHKLTLEANPKTPRPELGGKSFFDVTGGKFAWKTYMAAAGGTLLPGWQLRYIYFIDKTARERLTVPVIPFSRIDELGAGMYRGEKIFIAERRAG